MSDPNSPLQRMKEKALRLKGAVDAAPGKAAQLRDAVNQTTTQLKQLRTDLESTVAGLRADSEGSLAETLVELDRSIGLFARAGYELTGVDVEQGPVSRIIVHLDQLPEARSEALASLRMECAGRPLPEAILGALIRAEAMEEDISLADLVFRGLSVHVGPVPTVRLCWRRPMEPQVPGAPAPVSRAVPTSGTGPIPGPSIMAEYGAGSFFQRTTPGAGSTGPEATVSAASGALPPPTPSRIRPGSTPEHPPVTTTGDWRKDALARFKVMPDLGRRG